MTAEILTERLCSLLAAGVKQSSQTQQYNTLTLESLLSSGEWKDNWEYQVASKARYVAKISEAE